MFNKLTETKYNVQFNCSCHYLKSVLIQQAISNEAITLNASQINTILLKKIAARVRPYFTLFNLAECLFIRTNSRQGSSLHIPPFIVRYIYFIASHRIPLGLRWRSRRENLLLLRVTCVLFDLYFLYALWYVIFPLLLLYSFIIYFPILFLFKH